MSRRLKWSRSTLFPVLAAAVGAACTVGGCGSSHSGQSAGASATGPAQQNEPLVAFFTAPKQSGAALWAANCNRCHNAVGPSTFRPDEWDLVLNHMRLRANLTGQEVRAIAEYLKGSG